MIGNGAETRDDELVRTLSADGSISVRTLVATRLVDEAVRRHRASPTGAVALGRALMGAVLLASGTKNGETVQLQFRGDGPLGILTVIADSAGQVRGFAARPDVDTLLDGGPPDVARAVGSGNLAVVRYHPSWREPYTGIVELDTGEIAQDLARYLVTSEQTPSAIALGVWLDPEGGVAAAGGFLVQALPGASEPSVDQLEENARGLPNPSALIRDGCDADAMADQLLTGLPCERRQRSTPRFFCPCARERVLQTARLLGADELRGLVEQREALEIDCEFCREHYRIVPDELAGLVRDLAAEDRAG